MRRLGMMVVALMMVATMSFAQKVSDSKSMSFDKLSRYLQLDANQIAEVSEINTYFENQLCIERSESSRPETVLRTKEKGAVGTYTSCPVGSHPARPGTGLGHRAQRGRYGSERCSLPFREQRTESKAKRRRTGEEPVHIKR